MIAAYFASIVYLSGAVEVMTASSFSLLITALAALTERAQTAGETLDIVVTFGAKPVDPAQVSGCIDDTLALNAIHRKGGYYLYHQPMTAIEAEEIRF